MNQAFADAYNSGDIKQLLNLYEPSAVLAPQPAQRANGLLEIETALKGLMTLGGKMQSVNKYCIKVDNIALLQGEWRLSTMKNGNPLVISSRTS